MSEATGIQSTGMDMGVETDSDVAVAKAAAMGARVDELRKKYEAGAYGKGIVVHPLAEDVPWMDANQIAELAAAMERGMRTDPVLVYEGKVLDGKCTMVACELIGVEPQTVEYAGTQEEALMVVARNVYRRHLEKSQRAALVYLLHERAMRLGGKFSTGGRKTRDVLGATVGVSGRYVSECKDVDAVSRPLLLRVRNGELSLNSAAKLAEGLARLPPEDRESLAKAGLQELRCALREGERPASMDPVSQFISAARATTRTAESVSKLRPSEVRYSHELNRAVNSIGFVYSQLVALVARSGDTDGVELARKTIASLAEIKLEAGPEDLTKQAETADDVRPESPEPSEAEDMAGGALDPSALEWPQNAVMKVVIPAGAFKEAFRSASLAAMTAEGQSEIKRASNETRGCVRVTARKGEIVFDAGVSMFASRHVVKVAEGSMAAVEAEGAACVPAKEFKEVVSKIPPECGVGLCYTYQPVEPDPSTPEALKSLMPDGILSVGAIRKGRSVSKAHIESYPTERFAAVEYPDVTGLKLILSAPSKIIKDAYGAIRFTIDPKNANDLLNKVALYDSDDTVYFMGTDSRRCAIFPVKKASLVASAAFSDEEYGRPIPVTIDAEFLSPILAATGDEEVMTIAADSEGNYLYLFCGQSSYRIKRLARSLAAQYPDYRRMLSMTAGPVLLLDRVEFQLNLALMRPANEARGKYTFDKEKGIVRLSGKGLQAIKGADGELQYKQVSGDPVRSAFICLHTDYFREAVKQMKSENIKFSLNKDENKVRVEDETDPKFFYFMQVMSTNAAS